MSAMARAAGLVIAPFALAFGAHLMLHGHISPGGGFQGGVVVASLLAALFVSYGSRRSMAWLGKAVPLKSLGKIVFAFMGSVLFLVALAKLAHFPSAGTAFGPGPGQLLSAGAIPFLGIAIGAEVIAGLGMILVALAIGAEAEK